MIDREPIVSFILQELAVITGKPEANFSAESHLVGSQAVLNSREIVELLLSLEEYLEEHHQIRFDWSSDRTMSETQSMLRTVSTLAGYAAGYGG